MSGLLRICTAGSVDDGKSTLIGRLLYDSKQIFEDTLAGIERAKTVVVADDEPATALVERQVRRAGAEARRRA